MINSVSPYNSACLSAVLLPAGTYIHSIYVPAPSLRKFGWTTRELHSIQVKKLQFMAYKTLC